MIYVYWNLGNGTWSSKHCAVFGLGRVLHIVMMYKIV